MIYQRIRTERMTRGLTLEQLAARTGIAAPNLSRLEQGRVDARLSTIVRVLDALGLALELEPQTTISLADVAGRMQEGAGRIAAAGLGGRDVAARLRWKADRGDDTTVERRIVGSANGG